MSRFKKLRIWRFRNICEADIRFEGKVTVFYGDNAQGKTNILEAAYLVSNLQSFRTRRVADLVKSGEPKASLRAVVERNEGDTSLGVDLEGDGKKVTADGGNPSSTAEYLGYSRTVFFGPQDMELSAGSQLMRRRFVDRAAFSVSPCHLERLKDYARALRQRNEGLRSGLKNLDPWNEQVARLGFDITRERFSALEELKGRIKALHGEISGGRETIDLRIKAAEKVLSAGFEGLFKAYREDEEEDRSRGYTRHGCHRDKVEIALDSREISTHGSQGQRRTAAISLKLGLLSWTEEKTGDKPVFLLDDPGSELDRKRLGFLGEFIAQWKGQTLIATVGVDDVPVGGAGEVETYSVLKGAVTKSQ